MCVVYEDYESATHISKAVENMKRTKHVDVRYHFIRDYIEKGVIQVKYILIRRNRRQIY